MLLSEEDREQFQTPDEESNADEETLTGEDAPVGTEEQPEAPKSDEPDYKVKFSESTRENQRILAEKQKTDQENQTLKDGMAKLEAEKKELFEAINADNPNAAIIKSLQNRIEQTEKSVSEKELDRDLNDLVKQTPLAGKVADAIRKLAKVEGKSPKEIYETNFKPLEEEAGKAKADKIIKQKQHQPESGKGSINKDPSLSALGDDFNKLPLAERKKAFQKMGL